jgi:RNA polymerase sigma-70 factor, ECF subfamily
LQPSNKYNQYTDEDIIVLYQESQNQYLIGELYARYGHLVFGASLKILKNKQDCEDITMHIFENLGAKIIKHQITYFKSWLYQVTRNECLMLLRKYEKNREVEYLEQIDIHSESADDLINMHCFEQNMELALNKLKDEQRLAISLFYHQEKSYTQIAKETTWELSKVKSFIQNAKRNLKILLQNMCHEQ